VLITDTELAEAAATRLACCEHYGGDSLGVSAENRDYIRQVLRSLLRRAQ
jgi:hypothetical protein